MEVNKLEGKTLDGVSENVSVLAQAFPEVIVDGKVDFEKLRLILGEDIEDAEERYSFTWPGKRDAIKLAISRTTGTLRPDKENSRDWDTTQNLFIEGDNLEVLRVLQNTYRGKVKMIYIDPPYNTGKDFVYKDDFKDNIANYKEQAGLEGQSNADTTGRYHTNWLNMIYPRLRLAKNLLCDNGIIFITIDDHEVHNLRKVCDEIFGEDNFLANIAWKHTQQSKNDEPYFSRNYNAILCYRRSSKLEQLQFERTESDNTNYSNPDNDPKGDWRPGDVRSPSFRSTLKYAIKTPSGGFIQSPENGWRWSQKEVDSKISTGEIIFNEDQTKITRKIYLCDQEGRTPENVWADEKFGTTRQANAELKELFGDDVYFDTPKPTNLIKKILGLLYPNNEFIVMDFFAGSATSAHAVMNLNAEDGGNRRYIMVQLPEITPDDSKARKAGYKTIPEISRERIRRAGEKIKKDNADKLKERSTPLDIGFKAFTLDTTNFREWDTDTEDINASLLAALDTFKEGRTSEDALYEVLLKYGVDITEPVEVLTLAGKQVYSLAGNYLLVCLEKKISLIAVEEMVKLKPTRVVCYDDGFENDEVKQNALETLKRAGVEDVRVI